MTKHCEVHQIVYVDHTTGYRQVYNDSLVGLQRTFSYILARGAKSSDWAGHLNVNVKPRSIKSLVKHLNNAVINVTEGHTDVTYELVKE